MAYRNPQIPIDVGDVEELIDFSGVGNARDSVLTYDITIAEAPEAPNTEREYLASFLKMQSLRSAHVVEARIGPCYREIFSSEIRSLNDTRTHTLLVIGIDVMGVVDVMDEAARNIIHRVSVYSNMKADYEHLYRNLRQMSEELLFMYPIAKAHVL